MSFAAMPTVLVAAGAIVLAVLLALLQRLRPRRRRVRRPTALLWAQAGADAPMRQLGGRFRHWPAWLLAFGVALPLWLAAARPEPVAAASGPAQLFFLDVSPAMRVPGAAAAARRALIADVRSTPAADRAVYLGDLSNSRLLAPGESASLLAARLDRASGDGGDLAAFARWLERQPGGTTVRYYGAPAAIRAALPFPRNVTLMRGYLATVVPGNRGIVEMGATPAASGDATRADLLFRAIAADGRGLPAGALRVTLGGREVATGPVALGEGRFLLRDLPASGQVAVAAVRRGDGFDADDHATLNLPDRRPIGVAIGAGVPMAIRRAVHADAGLAEVAADTAEVAIVMDAADSRLPALVLPHAARQADAFLFTGPRADAALARRLDRTGLARIDAAALADETGRAIGVGTVTAAGSARVSAWRELFDARSGFVRSAAAPLFVGQSIRWLAARRPWSPYRQPGDTAAAALDGDVDAPLGAARTPAAGAGPWGAALTMSVALPPPPIRAAATGPLGDRALLLLLAAAALLLAVDWAMFQRGRMP